MTVEEMVTVFRHLDDGKKRLLLEREYGANTVQVSSPPHIYRNILSVIARFIDLSTFGRLKQTCHAFNQYLVEYRELTTIRQYYETGGVEPPLRAMINMFPACAMRLRRQLEHSLGGKEIECESIIFVRIRYDQFRNRFPWWHIGGSAAQVRYPFGYICKHNEPKKPRGHIFQLNPIDCFTIVGESIFVLSVSKMTEKQKEDRKRLIKMI